MRVGSFSLMIPEGRERDSGYVCLDHEQHFTLRLGNHHHVRCDAMVEVDGKSIGAFRVDSGRTITLERPGHDDGKFTFYKSDSAQAADAGVGKVDSSDRGLVRVTFRPELQTRERAEKTSGGILRGGPAFAGGLSFAGEGETLTSADSQMSNKGVSRGMASGITGLSGKSNQTFVDVPNLDYDPAGETVISLRLVVDTYRHPRELTSAPMANKVPSAVD